MTSDQASLRVENLRGYAQGELFLVTKSGGQLEALVYNSTGFGPLPAEKYNAVDPERLAAEAGVDLVWKNPRRFWMMDAASINILDQPRELGGLQFHLMAKMQMPQNFDPQRDQSAAAYHPMQIRRVSTYEFTAGRPVLLLRSPDQVTYVMQTFTNHVDHDLREEDLPRLGERLTLPEGWDFKPVTISQNLIIDTTGLAHIVPDNLANMYQGCVDGVNNFDPW
jgi:hypothetical protein